MFTSKHGTALLSNPSRQQPKRPSFFPSFLVPLYTLYSCTIATCLFEKETKTKREEATYSPTATITNQPNPHNYAETLVESAAPLPTHQICVIVHLHLPPRNVATTFTNHTADCLEHQTHISSININRSRTSDNPSTANHT